MLLHLYSLSSWENYLLLYWELLSWMDVRSCQIIFLVSIYMIMWLFFFSMLMCGVTFVDFQMLNQSCIPGINPVRVLSHFSHVQLFVTPWTTAHQAPLSTGLPRQEYWSGVSVPSSGDHPNPGIKPVSLMSPALAGRFFTTDTTWKLLGFNLLIFC